MIELLISLTLYLIKIKSSKVIMINNHFGDRAKRIRYNFILIVYQIYKIISALLNQVQNKSLLLNEYSNRVFFSIPPKRYISMLIYLFGVCCQKSWYLIINKFVKYILEKTTKMVFLKLISETTSQ